MKLENFKFALEYYTEATWEQFSKNIKNVNWLNEKTARSCLKEAFIWNETREKFNYWNKQCLSFPTYLTDKDIEQLTEVYFSPETGTTGSDSKPEVNQDQWACGCSMLQGHVTGCAQLKNPIDYSEGVKYAINHDQERFLAEVGRGK